MGMGGKNKGAMKMNEYAVERLLKALQSLTNEVQLFREQMAKTEPQKCDDCVWSVCNYNKVDWERAEQTEPSGCWVKENQGKQICDDCIKNTDCSWKKGE